MATGNTLDGKPYVATTLRIITAAFFAFAAGMGTFAAEVAPNAAQEAVAGWVRLKEALGEQFDAGGLWGLSPQIHTRRLQTRKILAMISTLR